LILKIKKVISIIFLEFFIVINVILTKEVRIYTETKFNIIPSMIIFIVSGIIFGVLLSIISKYLSDNSKENKYIIIFLLIINPIIQFLIFYFIGLLSPFTPVIVGYMTILMIHKLKN